MDNIKFPKQNEVKTDKDGMVLCTLCKTKVHLDDFSKTFLVCLKCKNRKRSDW